MDELLAKDMHIDTSGEGPKVLIFHTHSQETFVDSVEGDVGTSIVGMGAYLSELLNAKGISTIHHDGVYDLIDGKLDRSKAYEFSEVGVRKILEEKKQFLLNNQIAVWDVIASCEIKGSSDSSIKHVVPNDLNRILSVSHIEQIYTNGNTAFQLYEKYCKSQTHMDAIKLPSTSPANAVYSLEKLVEIWKSITQYTAHKK